MNHRKRRLLVVLGVGFSWAIVSVHPIWKYLSHAKTAVATGSGLLSIVLGMSWLDRLNRKQLQVSLGWFLLLFVTLAAAFAVLYPISLRHTLNSGSDREDALRVELEAVRHHQNPVDARTFLHNPPTPLPGAMLLAAPFYAIGRIAWQNLMWYALFFLFAIRFFRYRATALFFLAVFLLLAPANFSDFTSGGDYLTNFFYVAIALALFAWSLDKPSLVCLPAAAFLGVVLSSRGIYVLALIPLFALTIQRVSLTRALLLFAIVLTASVAVTLAVLAPHPIANLLKQLDQTSTGKLRFIPESLHPRWTLPLFAAIAAGTAFLVRVDLPRLFLVFAATSFLVLAPFAITFALHGAAQRLSYLSICSLSFVLWLLSKYEAMTVELAQADPRRRCIEG